MEAWYYEDPTRFSQEEREIEKKSGSQDLARMWSLYRYLEKNPPTSPADLKSRVFLDRQGTPAFDDATAQEVYNIWVSLKDPAQHAQEIIHYTRKRVGQTGGGPEPVNQEFLDKVFAKVYGLVRWPLASLLTSIGFDTEQDTTMGCIARANYNITSLLEKIVFFLYTLESNPTLGGPLWSILLDGLTKNTPRIISALEGPLTALNAVLVPVAGAGLVTEVISSIVVAVVSLSVALINLSRRKFGSAFALLLLGVPIIGPVFTATLTSMEQIYSDFKAKQAKLQQIPLIGSAFSWDPLEGGFRKRRVTKTNGRRKTARKSKAVDRAGR